MLCATSWADPTIAVLTPSRLPLYGPRTHRACLLSQGELDGHVVVCPCHAGVFDVRTGEVVEGPPPEPVRTYEVRVRGEGVEIAA